MLGRLHYEQKIAMVGTPFGAPVMQIWLHCGCNVLVLGDLDGSSKEEAHIRFKSVAEQKLKRTPGVIFVASSNRRLCAPATVWPPHGSVISHLLQTFVVLLLPPQTSNILHVDM
eukprot:Gb_27387 [translate_table: standard]